MDLFKNVITHLYVRFKYSVLKRYNSFLNLLNTFDKNVYFLNLIGYNDNNLKKFLKILFLYFIFKLLFDIIYLIFLFIFQIYLFFIEIIFDILFDFREIFKYLIKFNKFFIKVDNTYYKIVSWFFLLFSFNKINFSTIKNSLKTFTLFKVVDFFYNFISNVLWFFLTRKKTRKKYLFVKKLFINSFYFIFLCIITIISLFFQIFYINTIYIYFYNKAKTIDFYNFPQAKTKKRLVLIMLLNNIGYALSWLSWKIFNLILKIFSFFKNLKKNIKKK